MELVRGDPPLYSGRTVLSGIFIPVWGMSEQWHGNKEIKDNIQTSSFPNTSFLPCMCNTSSLPGMPEMCEPLRIYAEQAYLPSSVRLEIISPLSPKLVENCP